MYVFVYLHNHIYHLKNLRIPSHIVILFFSILLWPGLMLQSLLSI